MKDVIQTWIDRAIRIFVGQGTVLAFLSLTSQASNDLIASQSLNMNFFNTILFLIIGSLSIFFSLLSVIVLYMATFQEKYEKELLTIGQLILIVSLGVLLGLFAIVIKKSLTRGTIYVEQARQVVPLAVFGKYLLQKRATKSTE